MDFNDLRAEAAERRELEQGIIAALALAEWLAEARGPDDKLVILKPPRMVGEALDHLTIATRANLLPRDDD